MGTFSPSVSMYKLSQTFLFDFCNGLFFKSILKVKGCLRPSIAVLLGAVFTAGYNEQEMPGEVCTEVVPPPGMSNMGF